LQQADRRDELNSVKRAFTTHRPKAELLAPPEGAVVSLPDHKGAILDFSFGEFRLDTARKMLWRAEEYVALGTRAYAILALLIEAEGKLVTKAELFDQAWPGVTVDEANLRVQIANLRKVLGVAGRNIVTEQAIGYCFRGDVRRFVEPRPVAEIRRFRAPTGLSNPIGRERDVASVRDALIADRIVSLVGPGGIGKTTLALEIAAQVDAQFLDGICFADLSQAVDAREVAMAVAAALELPVTEGPDVVTYFRTRRLLIVLDCCERAIEAAAELADQLLSTAPGVSVLATSREALRIPGELVVHVGGLDLPPEDPLTPPAPLEFGAVALFCRTAKAVNAGFQTSGKIMTVIADICRRLDGIPLAIDIAAGLTGALEVEQIRAELEERISVLTLGRRGGLPRHRTLDAAIAWSYDALSSKEAIALRRLSVFADWFRMECALETIVFDDLDKAAAKLAVVSLAQKSLLNVESRDGFLVYRLLETTRHFAVARIESVEEAWTLGSMHAAYILRRLTSMDWERYSPTRDRRAALILVKDVREAVAWSYAHGRDPGLPLELTIAAERLWLELSLFAEHGQRMKQANDWLEQTGVADSWLRACVLTGLAAGVLYDPLDADRIDIVHKALLLTDTLSDRELYMRNLFNASYFHVVRHQAYESDDFAKRLLAEARAAGREDVVVFATISGAIPWLEMGRWNDARATFEKFLKTSPKEPPRSVSIYFGFNISSVCLFELGTIDCLQGDLKRGFERIDEALLLTAQDQHAQTRFQVLFFAACWAGFQSGDRDRARRYLDMLEHQARDFGPWVFMTSVYKAWLAFIDGRLSEASTLLEAFLSVGIPCASLDGTFQLLYSDVCRALGNLDGAERAVSKVLSLSTGPDDPFMVGPALRAQADNLVARGDAAAFAKAGLLYGRAIENARKHGAIMFEIPAVLGLANLERLQGRCNRARPLLADLLDRATALEMPAADTIQALLRDLVGADHAGVQHRLA